MGCVTAARRDVRDTPVRVLLVEADTAHASLIRDSLATAGEGLFDLERVDRLVTALRVLQERAFDVILLDLDLPDAEGFETFDRFHAAVPGSPVVVLSGVDDETIAAKTVRGGAQDYLVKGDVSAGLLGRSLRYAIERHRAEQALAARERLLELVFDTEPECVKVLRPDGTIMTMNRAGLAMIEADGLEQAVGRRATDLVVPEHREAFDGLTARVFAGESGSLEFEVIGFGGTRRWLETHAVPLRDLDGGVFALLSITRDVTDRRRLQAELLQAQKMEVVGQLAGGIAHDFNNLLTVIDGRAQLMLNRLPPEDPSHRDARLIQDTTARATRLVKQLLAFSRKELSRPEVVDADEAVGGLATMLMRLIREDIHLVIARGAEGARTLIDRTHLEQIVVNLVVNARDAMPDGGTLTIATSSEDADQPGRAGTPPVRRWVVVEVRDTGVGMDERTRARLFEPFFTTKGVRGTGIGLATVRAILRTYGGHIVVESEPGRGSTFRVYLPATDARLAPAIVARPRAGAHGRETILLVEDDPDVRDLAREVLVDHGYTVLLAPSGAEAMRIAHGYTGSIDLLLTDVVMPQMSGPDVAHRVQAARPGIPVLYMSGYVDEMTAAQTADSHAVLLAKPFDAVSLTAKVRQVLDG
ncbi:MAG: response regulator [Candidatus Rokubacteria bacterium]|nr:response regulator [Candidatus Rokubacteria bacterium]